MSMNLMLTKELLNGNELVNTTLLNQTPTEITHEAMSSDNPLGIYVKWLREMNCYNQNHVDKIQLYLDDGWQFTMI